MFDSKKFEVAEVVATCATSLIEFVETINDEQGFELEVGQGLSVVKFVLTCTGDEYIHEIKDHLQSYSDYELRMFNIQRMVVAED